MRNGHSTVMSIATRAWKSFGKLLSCVCDGIGLHHITFSHSTFKLCNNHYLCCHHFFCLFVFCVGVVLVVEVSGYYSSPMPGVKDG